MAEQLEKLAAALKAGGVNAWVWRTGKHPEAVSVLGVDTGDDEPTNWLGESESPALAFAMLDVLDERGLGTSLSAIYYDQIVGWDCTACFLSNKIVGVHHTRTGAVAECLISAHDAGLLKEGGGRG